MKKDTDDKNEKIESATSLVNFIKLLKSKMIC